MESPDDALREWIMNRFYTYGCIEDAAVDADALMAWMHGRGWYFEHIPEPADR